MKKETRTERRNRQRESSTYKWLMKTLKKNAEGGKGRDI
jgi:translation elongation factor EF-1alpha